MTRKELAALSDRRAGTMLRLEADRIHREFVTGTLDQATAIVVERAVADLGRLGEEIAREKSARIVEKSVGRLADALDADDHVLGRNDRPRRPVMVGMAILAGWDLGALNPSDQSLPTGATGTAPDSSTGQSPPARTVDLPAPARISLRAGVVRSPGPVLSGTGRSRPDLIGAVGCVIVGGLSRGEIRSPASGGTRSKPS